MPRVQGSTPVNTPKTLPALAREHEVLSPLLEALKTQAELLAAKRPDGWAPKEALRMANRLLRRIQSVVARETTARYVRPLPADRPVANADLAMALGQAHAALSSFRTRYYGWNDAAGEFAWRTSASGTQHRGRPKPPSAEARRALARRQLEARLLRQIGEG